VVLGCVGVVIVGLGASLWVVDEWDSIPAQLFVVAVLSAQIMHLSRPIWDDSVVYYMV
jgi:hypothetical protein